MTLRDLHLRRSSPATDRPARSISVTTSARWLTVYDSSARTSRSFAMSFATVPRFRAQPRARCSRKYVTYLHWDRYEGRLARRERGRALHDSGSPRHELSRAATRPTRALAFGAASHRIA